MICDVTGSQQVKGGCVVIAMSRLYSEKKNVFFIVFILMFVKGTPLSLKESLEPLQYLPNSVQYWLLLEHPTLRYY